VTKRVLSMWENTILVAAAAGGDQRAGSWTRASKRELVALGALFSVLILVSDALNIRAGMEVMTVAVVVAAVAITRQPMAFFRDWWFFLAGLVLWSFSGAVAADSPFKPHLDVLINADRLLFFGRDPVVVIQNALAHRGTVGPIDVFAAAVYNLHVPEPYIAGYFLWRINRAVFFQFVAAVMILLVASFVTFIVFPAVPPWLAPGYGKVTGVFNGFGYVLKWHPMPFHGTPIFYLFKLAGDSVAAFPSQHAALPLLECFAFAACTPRRIWLWLVCWIVAVLFTIVYLGEHWVIDALAGYAYAIVVFGAVRIFVVSSPSRRRP
jgi:hypothetical protein